MCFEHEGTVWLVTSWLVETATGYATPERMLRVGSLLEMMQRRSDHSDFDYENVLLPIALIDDLVVPSETPFEVRSLPDQPRVHRNEIRMLPAFP